MRTWLSGVVAVVLILAVAGCATSRSGNVYSRDQSRVVHEVYDATVLYVRPVQIEGTKSGLGTVAGGVLGAVVGHTIGGGSGKAVATVAGGIVGAVAGSVAEEGVTKRNGVEITVELDNGDTIAIVQEADEVFDVGDQVRVMMRPDGSARVVQ